MAIEKILYVLNNSKAKKSHQLVLLRIADHTNSEGLAWPSYARLARETGLTRRWVIRIIADLATVGELEIVPYASPKGDQGYRIWTGEVSSPGMKSSGEVSSAEVVNSVHPNLSLEPIAEDRFLTHEEAVKLGLTPGSKLYKQATGT